MSETTVPVLRLKPREERRLRTGHPWVFSNEIDTAATPLRGLTAGGEVVIEDSRGRALGRAYVNPHSLITARLFSHDPQQSLDADFIGARLEQALALREQLFPDPYYRLVFGESDGLPGLIIDRYGDVFVLQAGTAGMEQAQPEIVAALLARFAPSAIVARNETSVRDLEQLPRYTRALHGDLPTEIRVRENGLEYRAPLATGQKTGWFYDHRSARKRLLPLSKDARVLDVFSYCGAWGVLAAVHGASEVICLDSSAPALEYVVSNASANGVADVVTTMHGDAVASMRSLLVAEERFDVVVVDPPAFIKRRKDHKAGLQGYRTLNELAVRLVKPGGFLISASCSMQLSGAELLDTVRGAARQHDRQVQMIAADGQAEDHPVHPAVVETSYLKSFLLRVLNPV